MLLSVLTLFLKEVVKVEKYNYSMLRVVCVGKIKSCKFCEDIINDKTNVYEGFCKKCGRPLDKNPGEDCRFIVGYVDRRFHQQEKVHFRCRYCNTLTTL